MDYRQQLPPSMASTGSVGTGAGGALTEEEENIDMVNDMVDERPWLQHYIDAAQ
jgi:hypothetical protein